MSGVDRNPDPIGGATETQAQAASWLRQQHFEEWSEDRQAALNTWLGESLAHQVAYIRLEAAWNRTERVTALSQPMRNGLPHRFESFRSKCFAIAAVAVFAVIAAALAVNYTAQPAEKSFATPVGGRETVSFADGSQIDLNTNTVLRARVSATSRTVTLERGEAYFRIKHDANHPFVAMAAGHRITDLGTQFLVRNEPNRLEVDLVEGRARFDAQDRQVRPISVELRPGDVVVARNSEISVTRKAAPAIARELGWRHGVVVFDDTTLADAVAEFNRYSTKKLIISDRYVAALKINGTFQVDNLEVFAETAQDALGLRLKHRGNEIAISH